MKVDKVFITNIPSFYKIKLYNEISKRIDIFVVFLSKNAKDRNSDFYDNKIEFNYIIIDELSSIKKIIKMNNIIRKLSYKELIISGWDDIVSWFLAFKSPRKKNAVVVESSVYESTIYGIKGLLKNFFLLMFSKAYVPGKSNTELLKKLNFKGKIIETKGVGLYNRVKISSIRKVSTVKKILYVGRLVPEKNIEWLIKYFEKKTDFILEIVGFGILENELRNLAKDSTNIKFLGAVNNKELCEIYQNNDIFILPSKSEPWGLVVEEALNNGIPVLVSDRVGCADEIVVNGVNGYIYKLDDELDFENKLNMLIDNYDFVQKNVFNIDFEKIEKNQVDCYC